MRELFKNHPLMVMASAIKLRVNNIVILTGIIFFTYIATTGEINHQGSDIINPYRYYLAVCNNANFSDFIEIYDGRKFEIFLPALINVIAILFGEITLNEFAFILCLINNIIFIFSVKKIFEINKTYISSSGLSFCIIFLVLLFPYGLVQQLLRQSLSISIFIYAISRGSNLLKLFYICLSLLCHYYSLYLLLIWLIITIIYKNIKYKVIIIYYLTPLLFILFIGFDHPTVVNFNNDSTFTLNYRDAYLLLLLIILSIFLFNKIGNLYHCILFFIYNYYMFIYIYYIYSLSGFFQRIFLFNILINPMLIAYAFMLLFSNNKYNYLLRFGTLAVTFLIMLISISLKSYESWYFIYFPFLA